VTLKDAARGVLVAHKRVLSELERSAERQATPEDLALALVALGSAVRVLAVELGPCCCGAGYDLHPLRTCEQWHRYTSGHHASARLHLR
jgi:hypothetical protein